MALDPNAFAQAAQSYLQKPPEGTPTEQPGQAPGAPPAYRPPAPPPAAAPKPNPLGFLAGLNPPQAPLPAGSTDPAYLAFQRSLNYQQSIAQQSAQQQLQALQNQMLLGPQTLAEQGVISRRNISGAAESRGIFQSGERLQTLADERTQEAQKLAALRLQGSTQYGGIITSLQQQLASIANQRAEQALADEVRNPTPVAA